MNNFEERQVWVDWLRVLACLLVMVVHSSEPFYLAGYDTLILTRSDLLWASIIDSAARMSVPLFVVASSYLMFPLHYSTAEFCRKRAVRILIPFAIWSLVYALKSDAPATNIKYLLLNFNFSASHLWFIYMLLGLYLIMPLLSPWAREVGRKELRIYISIWLFATLIPLLRDIMTQGNVNYIMGPTYIPNQAEFPLWGECSWNKYGTFYYISGCIGYLLVGLYLKRFAQVLPWKQSFMKAIPLLLVGLAIIECGFLFKGLDLSDGSFPIKGDWKSTIWMETTWHNDTFGVALMTIGALIIIRKINCSGTFYQKIILPVSKASYGMYLMHLIVLPEVSKWLRQVLGTGIEGLLGSFTTPVQILLTAILTFTITAIVSAALRRIPFIGKYIIG